MYPDHSYYSKNFKTEICVHFQEYLPIRGDAEFCKLAAGLLYVSNFIAIFLLIVNYYLVSRYGSDAAVLKENRVAMVSNFTFISLTLLDVQQQCLSGTGSLRIACDFFRKFLGNRAVYYSK